MKWLEDLVLRARRKDGRAGAAIHDAYRWFLQWNVPESDLLQKAYRNLYLAHDAGLGSAELIAAKLLYEPMVRARFARVGRRLHVSALPYIRGNCRISVGDDLTLSNITVHSGRFFEAPELVIGDGCTIGFQAIFTVNQRITIGNHVSIAGRACIADSDGHPGSLERRMRNDPLSPDDIKPVTIGDHVWIGRGAQVLKGVTIGRGAVIAAGSVVSSDVPEGALAMGVPARLVVRPRNDSA